VFQKPFSTGEPDLAGFDDQSTPDRKLASAALSGQQGSSPSLGRRTYEKGLQTLVWKAGDENDDDLDEGQACLAVELCFLPHVHYLLIYARNS